MNMRMFSRYGFLLGLIAVSAVVNSCKKEGGTFHEVVYPNVNVSLRSTNGQIIVPTGSNFSKTPALVTIPVPVALSGIAPQIFSVNIGVNNDTVNQLIASGKLPNTVLLPATYYQLPDITDIRFGIDTSSFNLGVDMTAIEKNYGKNLALAVGLSNPTKNNTLAPGQSTAIVLLNTTQIIRPEEIHYVSFTDAGSAYAVPNGQNYQISSSSLTVTLGISLAGVPTSAFTVNVNADPDTVQALINNGTLTNAVSLTSDQYSYPPVVNFSGGKNSSSLDLQVSIPALKANISKKVAVALTLSDPSNHLLDTLKKTIVVVFDPGNLIETDITNNNTIFTVQYENDNPNDQGENSAHLIDNNINTKFLLFHFTPPAWMQLEFPAPVVAGAYTITSANDAPGRDPKNWQMLGSNDGVNWTVLDVETNQIFTSRFQTQHYIFDNKTAYKYFRWNVTANAGDGLFQCAEWRLLHRP